VVPAAAELVLPVTRSGVEADDEAGLGAGDTLEVRVRPRQPARHARAEDVAWRGARAAVADGPFGDGGRPVPRVKARGADRVAVGADGQCARGVGAEREDR